MTTKQDIETWFDEGKKKNKAYMIIVCDTYSHEDYPVYANNKEAAEEKRKYYNGNNMQRIMEIYNLDHNKDDQLNKHRCFNL